MPEHLTYRIKKRPQQDMRAEFIDPIDLMPVAGTISRAKKITKATRRTYRWLKRKRVPKTKRIIVSGLSGSHQLLRSKRVSPLGLPLFVVHTAGRGAARAFNQGKGPKDVARALWFGGRGAMATSKMGFQKAIRPATSFGKASRRTYRMLGDAVPAKKRIGASAAIGLRQTMKDTKGLKKFYGYDKRGRRIVRRVLNRGRKLKRRFKRKK